VARIRALNPLVAVNTTTKTLENLDLTAFHVCCVSGVPVANMMEASKAARKNGNQFFATDTYGFFGFIFSDLGDVFTFDKTTEIKGVKETKRMSVGFVPMETAFKATWSQTTNPVFVFLLLLQVFWQKHNRQPKVADFGEIISLRDSLIEKHSERQPGAKFRKIRDSGDLCKNFLQHSGTELSPVCAIVGGLAAQEIVRAVCRNEEPLRNLFTYNAYDGSGWAGELFS